jgi:hypothetical protein
MRQVLVRKPLASGENKLIRATVLSEKDGMLRVMLPGARVPTEIKASDTISPASVFGTGVRCQATGVLQKVYPTSPFALGNVLKERM